MADPERRTWCRIALALGITPREARERLTSSDFTELAAYFRLEPIGPDACRWQLAMIGARICAVLGDKEIRASDFMIVPAEVDSGGDLDDDGPGTTLADLGGLDDAPSPAATRRRWEDFDSD